MLGRGEESPSCLLQLSTKLKQEILQQIPVVTWLQEGRMRMQPSPLGMLLGQVTIHPQSTTVPGQPWRVPRGWGQQLGTPQLAGDISGASVGLLCSSLQAEASISWPSPERQTGDKEGWDQGPCPHLRGRGGAPQPTALLFITDHRITFPPLQIHEVPPN